MQFTPIRQNNENTKCVVFLFVISAYTAGFLSICLILQWFCITETINLCTTVVFDYAF